ncbi:hypothetical protein M8J76_009065 [Diaphorina citri]|nr:hypothetical protein M8J75_004331 [Diaphorina citri]KAI5705174.1 hypothetical protein M8J75_012635 [Diaphorina citri]KAI5736984.1 hypothetical protein M8J76_009065 [Diaphorina citri]
MPCLPKSAGRLVLNLVRRLHQDILDWIFALKRSWLNCCNGEVARNSDSAAPSDEKTNNNSSVKNHNPPHAELTQKKSYEISVTKMAWFHSVNRERAVQMVAAGGEGCFLVRPSSSSEPLTLTLWYGGRAYNIFIRKRDDNKIGLGTFKPNEVAFNTVEELVNYYKSCELILYSDGQITGRTKLGAFPA